MLLRAARDYTPQLHVPVRCRACQLQLCKSRTEKPHAGLKETGRDLTTDTAQYACDSCGAVMEWSGNPARPGWAHRRESAARETDQREAAGAPAGPA
jgi:hypothetical protein